MVEERPKLTKINAKVSTDKKIYEGFGKTKVKLDLVDENGNKVSDANVKATLSTREGKKELKSKTNEDGHTSFDIDLDKEGKTTQIKRLLINGDHPFQI